ncbi:MAG: imidazole glycerol phosphate synthase subunit HisF [Acidimicrobiales bacterium]
MLKTRLIPCLLLKDGLLVRSERFSIHQAIGYPLNEVDRFNQWAVDELIYLDISRGKDHSEAGRADHKVKGFETTLDILEAVSRTCFMPLTFGGRIASIEDMRARFLRGADKVTINTAAVESPALITQASELFGASSIVVSIDVRRHDDGRCEVLTHGGSHPTGLDPVRWAVEAERRGAGEILLNSVDRDGTGRGYDIELIRSVAESVGVPVVACGGVGRYEDFAKGALEGKAAAVAAANIFHFKELSDRNAKRAMARAGLKVRPP